jgi:hypothetical protein
MNTTHFALIGIFSGLTASTLLGGRLIFPHLKRGYLELGFLSHVILGSGAAMAWDVSLPQAYLAGTFFTVLLSLASVRLFPALAGMGKIPHQLNGGDGKRLEMLRRKHRVILQNVATYGAGEVPVHLLLIKEESEKEIAELEGEVGRWN